MAIDTASPAFGKGDQSVPGGSDLSDEAGQPRLDTLSRAGLELVDNTIGFLDIGAFEVQTGGNSTAVVNINGTQTPLSFVVSMKMDESINNGAVTITLDGAAYTYSAGTVKGVGVVIGQLSTTVTVDKTPATVPMTVEAENGGTIDVYGEAGGMTVNGEGGTAQVNVSGANYNLQGIAGGIFVNAAGGQVNLAVDDSNESSVPSPNGFLQGQFVGGLIPRVDPSLKGLSAGAITYSSTGVNSTIVIGYGTLHVDQTGTGSTTILGTGAETEIIVGGAAGSLSGIHGPIDIEPTTANMTLRVDDSRVAGATMSLVHDTVSGGPARC